MTGHGWWRRTGPVALVLLVGLGLAGLAAKRQETANHDRMTAEFDNLTSGIASQISSRLWRYQYGLRGARGAIIGAGYEGITRTRFRIYHESRDVDAEFPGARGFGFIRRVPIAQEADFTAAARADGAPDFAVRSLGPNDGDRYVIQYIEPVERNGPAVGLDIASEANRREAARRAMRTGEATITAPITLVQATAKPTQSFLLLLPVYHYGVPRSTPAEREAALFGWVYAPLVMSEILHDIDASGDRVSLALFDATDNGGEYPFFAANALHSPIEEGADGLLHEEVTLPIYGRQWRLEVKATPTFAEGLHQTTPQDVFLAGSVAAMLIAALFYAYRDNLERRRDGLARQALLANIVENANDAIVAEDVSGVITSWNRAAERIFGYPATEAVGRLSAEILWRGSYSDDFESLRDRALDGLATAAFDTAGLRRDGQAVEIAVTAAPITDPGGEVIGIGSTIRDITDRRSAERALKAFNATLERQVAERTSQLETARRDLQTILDTVPSMIGYWDHNLVCRVANKAYCEWFGVVPNQMPGRDLRDLLGPAYEGIRAHVDGALRGEQQTFERTIPHPDGSAGGRQLAYYLPDVMAGEVRGFYVLLHDVTELTEGRQKLAAALRDNQALLNTIKLHALYSETDIDGHIIDLNEGLCRITGYSRDELIGRNITLLSSGVHDPVFIRSLRDTIYSGEVWRGDLCNRAKDGSLHWFDTIIVPFSDETGKIAKFISLRTDITARLAADQALLEAKHSAEAANAAKSAFLANMSHEIRTPLNAVIGLGHLLEHTVLDDQQHDYVRKSLSASRALLGLVNDILDLAKIEAGEMTVEAIPFDVEALLADLKDVIGPQAEAKHLKLDLETESPLPPLVIGDPTRVRQILFNLLSNAVKFTDRGSVRIGARVIGSDADEAIEFRIQDTGIGIAPEVLPRLFTPFEQADSSTTRRFGGTGLGLSIVRHLVDLLQGRVAVESEEGVGSVFTVTLPLQLPESERARPAAADETPAAEVRLDGIRVLVVDDADVNREIASRLLAHRGASVESCADGIAALEALRQAPGGFDVVLTDVQMPGIDGIELTRRIRRDMGLTTLPVIALSADVLGTERQKALDAGMNDFILKPFDPSMLIGRIRRLADAARDDARAERPAPAAPCAPTKPWSLVEGIDGVDASDAGIRLNRDTNLFLSVLRRILGEFADLETVTPPVDHLAARTLAARLHKLRGSAGLIGALTVARLAGDLEKRLAADAGAAPIVEGLTGLAQSLAELRRASAAALSDDGGTHPTAAAVETSDLDALAAMLERRDFAALAAFQRLAPGLEARLTAPEFRTLKAAVEGLRFDQALAVLEGAAAA